jgi:DNA-binding CsgD family transcriptional regulator
MAHEPGNVAVTNYDVVGTRRVRPKISRPVALRAFAPSGFVPRLLTREDALGSGDRLLVLQAHALDAVAALIPATASMFISVSRRLSVQGGVVLVAPRADVDLEALWEHHAGDAESHDPFSARRLHPPHSTVLALEQVEDHAPLYTAALRAAGWGDRVAMYLRLAGTIVGVVSLLRAAEQPGFSSADASKLRRIQPLLEHVYGSALEPGTTTARDVLRNSGLTTRETDVAELVGRGASNAEIATSLHVSEATVKTHLTRIYTKVGVRTRTQLALLVGGAPRGRAPQTFG